MVRWISLLLLLGVPLTGCAHRLNTPWQPSSGWTQIRTQHFRIYTTTPHLAGQLTENLEISHRVLSAFLYPEGNLPASLSEIDVLLADTSNPDFFQLFGPRRYHAAVAQVPGGGPIGEHGLIVLRSYDDSGRHALAHLFTHALVPDVPYWMHEGLAEMFASSYIFNRHKLFEYAAFTPLQGAPVVPVEKLLASSSQEFDHSDFPIFYRYAATCLVSYLITGGDGHMGDRFVPLLLRLEKKPFEQAFAETYPEIMVSQLEPRLQRWFQATPIRPILRLFPMPPLDRRVYGRTAASDANMRLLFAGLESMHVSDGYADWFPSPSADIARVAAKASAQ